MSSPPTRTAPPPSSVGELEALLRGLGDLGGAADEARHDAALLLAGKALPELQVDLDLPLFVAVQGGTNVGKSTIFNTLLGKILSPAMVTASATKHPLLFVHERWRDRFLGAPIFADLACRELEDPKELIVEPERTERFYFRFHDDARLADLALIDSPDFDGALESNARVAARVAALSDVTVFVTTPQKYRDRLLVEHLRRLLRLKAETILIFNMTDEAIVFATLVDDLRATIGEGARGLRAVQLPPVGGRHPEDALAGVLGAAVLEPLLAVERRKAKERSFTQALSRALDLAEDVVARTAGETRLAREIQACAEAAALEAALDYDRRFRLAFPEETIAIRRVLRLTELGPRLQLGEAVERSSGPLRLVGAALRRAGDATRRLLIRLSRGDEGTLEPGEAALREYARARDEADQLEAQRAAESVRVRVESFVRSREDASSLARGLLRSHLVPGFAGTLAERVGATHAEQLRASGQTGAEIPGKVESWLASHPGQARAGAAAAILLKLTLGLVLAWSLPPSGSILDWLHPLKWLYFAAGYLAGAYGLALGVTLLLRRRHQLRVARQGAARQTLEIALLEPLRAALRKLLSEDDLRRIATLSHELRGYLASSGTGSKPAPPQG